MARKLINKLVKPSTIAFTQEARRTPGYSFFDWLHGYIYAHWAYFYISVGTGEHPLTRLLEPLVRLLAPQLLSDHTSFTDFYHGKVVPLGEATRLVTVEEDIGPIDLERVIPYPHARDIVLRNPDHIVALDCPCRDARPNPCQPLDVCLVVGEPFASFAIEHHPNRSRWITSEEAVEILRAENERGHVHHAFFKDAMLNRFYVICNCCNCCCGAMQFHQHGVPMLASSGYISCVNADLCVGCGICTDFCQFNALSMGNDIIAVDTAACMGCGVCVSKCTQGALSLVREPTKGKPLEIQLVTDAAKSRRCF
jgi:NAD-dependent dihydropyrimidine dehydrogenase PreA subunit